MPNNMNLSGMNPNIMAILDGGLKPTNNLPGLDTDTSNEIKQQILLKPFFSRRLVAGAGIVCSNADEAESKVRLFNEQKLMVALVVNCTGYVFMNKSYGGIITQQLLELSHKDVDFKPLFKKCNGCDNQICNPIIENNEWKGYDSTYKVGDGFGLNKDEAYMICLNGEGGYIYPSDDGQKNCMREYGIWMKEKPIITISEDYLNFLIEYESGGLDDWKYAKDVGDGAITIAFGVVILSRDGVYPLEEDTYNYYMDKKNNNIPITMQEAYELTKVRLQEDIDLLNAKIAEKDWVLTDNRYDAIIDLTWNLGQEALGYRCTELIATGDLTDVNIKKELEKEIIETAKFTTTDGVKQWSKGLVERRLDVIRIAEGGEGSYTRNEMDPKDWNQNAYDILKSYGLDNETIDQHAIQAVKEY